LKTLPRVSVPLKSGRLLKHRSYLLLYYSQTQSRVLQKSMSLKYEPASEPLHISVKYEVARGWIPRSDATCSGFASGSCTSLLSKLDSLFGRGVECRGLSHGRNLRTAALKGFFFFFILVTGPRRSLSLELSDTRVYEPPNTSPKHPGS